MRKVMKCTGIVLGGLIGLALLAVLALYPIGMKRLNRSYTNIPVETIDIPSGAAAVARGRHTAIVWGCAKCHGDNLGGMMLANDPFIGAIPASNLTSGKGGIAGSYSNADWTRAIRHGVKPDGRVEVFMYDYYSTMSDQDLGVLIAYLKQLSPVDSDYPAVRVGPVLAAAPVVGLLTPAAELIDHSATRPAAPAPGATVQYGTYLSALCTECHGNRLAGKLAMWKQEDFVRAVRTGVLPNGKRLGSAMPLKTYGEIDDTELAALWLYLRSSAAAK